ncbi:MAG TPA: hypothetical protein VGK59_12030 [Ohtaekwangia sp.]
MKRLLSGFILLLLTHTVLLAQVDTTKGILNNQLSKQVIKRVSKKQRDTTLVAIKSEDAFMPYSGKIIRNITIKHIGFERTMYSDRTLKSRAINVANSLHSNTQESVIQDNLFIRRNKPLNPYLVADNERYLRDLDFILDSKIYVRRVKGSKDSVDLEVVTRDVFSLGITGSADGVDEYSIGIYDANLMGLGQRVQGDVGFEVGKTPVAGVNLLYRKSSLGGTLINGSLGYTQLNNARSLGEEYEYAYFVRLDRPLVSPYSRLAGGLEVSQNWSKNVYLDRDSLFLRYRYNVTDFWGGYNLGIKNMVKNRNRHFVALRYFRQHFSRQPKQEDNQVLPLYNDSKFVLGEFTFYKKNYYKTRYVYGFGRTEDIPYGQTVSLTTGWMKELGIERPYVGASIIRSDVMKEGNFYEAEAGIGTFLNNGKSEDGSLFVSVQYYSKLFETGKVKIRHFVRAGYAQAINNRIRELVALNEELRGFSPDSLYGAQRISLRAETTLFTNWKLAGFRFAPFLSLESAYLKESEENQNVLPRHFYWGSTGGMRIRNENLIFGTIELRAFYFPTDLQGVDQFSFKITTNVRLKYSGYFVRPPSLVRYN